MKAFASKALVYDPEEILSYPFAENMCSNIRAFCDSENILDVGIYTGSYVSLIPYVTWLSKNLNAREACIKYYKDVRNVDIEKRVYR